ncbi:hypothetical protein EsVE80_15970 [Enterococcus saigonensis]|uniref:DUF2929 domain-containing protein n=1 Tax=Enterococcus saigonensis TaxID=1805431 RepID=A0A679IQ81_9ENTE|nr:YjzD family protein [Enterococcus saigonensis]BCA86074.1 hypothetical protein EsVE80_15970 [Enterococcus saigonensis]
MKYLVTLFWTYILGQVVCYLGSALNSGTYDFKLSSIISLIVGVIIILIAEVATPKKKHA